MRNIYASGEYLNKDELDAEKKEKLLIERFYVCWSIVKDLIIETVG